MVKAGDIQPLYNSYHLAMAEWDNICYCGFRCAIEVHSFLRNNHHRGLNFQEWRFAEAVRVGEEIEKIIREAEDGTLER